MTQLKKRQRKMGLDNGIQLKLASKKVPEDFPDKGSLDKWDFDTLEKTGELEVAYWRKCWGIREMILGVLHADQGGGEYPVKAEDLPAIRRGLVKFLNPKTWEEDADSIWEYEEMYETLLQQLLNLKWLEKYLKDHPEDSASFYDSY